MREIILRARQARQCKVEWGADRSDSSCSSTTYVKYTSSGGARIRGLEGLFFPSPSLSLSFFLRTSSRFSHFFFLLKTKGLRERICPPSSMHATRVQNSKLNLVALISHVYLNVVEVAIKVRNALRDFFFLWCGMQLATTLSVPNYRLFWQI